MKNIPIKEDNIVSSYSLSYNNIVSLFVQYAEDNMDKYKDYHNFNEIKKSFDILKSNKAITATQKLCHKSENGVKTLAIPIAIIQNGNTEPLISFNVYLKDIIVMHRYNLEVNHPDIMKELTENAEILAADVFNSDTFDLKSAITIDGEYYSNLNELDHSNNINIKPFNLIYFIDKRQ